MEKKIDTCKKGIQIVLVVLLLTSCGNAVNKLDPDKLRVFNSDIANLRKELQDIDKKTKSTADVRKVVKSYEALNDTKTFASSSDRAVFEALKTLGTIENEKISPKVGDLQKALADTNSFKPEPNDQPIYGEKTNKSLITYLVEIEHKVDKARSRPLRDSNRKMPFKIIIPSLLGLTLLGILGGLGFWIWKLGQQIVALHNSQKKLNSEINQINQSLKRKDNQDYSSLKQDYSSLKNDVHQLIQRLENQETTFNTFAHESRKLNVANVQSSEYPQTTRATQPRSDVRSAQIYPPNASQYQPTPSPSAPPAAYLRLVKQYNQSPNSLAAHAAGVSQTEESLKLNLQDSSQTNVILAQDNSPNYWIVRDESDDLWLFPKAGWEPSIGTLESFVKLFTFTGNPSRRYQVVKPASVIETGQRDWSLKEPGEIEFS
jgi:hypothetical protein